MILDQRQPLMPSILRLTLSISLAASPLASAAAQISAPAVQVRVNPVPGGWAGASMGLSSPGLSQGASLTAGGTLNPALPWASRTPAVEHAPAAVESAPAQPAPAPARSASVSSASSSKPLPLDHSVSPSVSEPVVTVAANAASPARSAPAQSAPAAARSASVLSASSSKPLPLDHSVSDPAAGVSVVQAQALAQAAPHADLRLLGALSASKDAARLWENGRLSAAPATRKAGEARASAAAQGRRPAASVPGLGRATAQGRSPLPQVPLSRESADAPILLPSQDWRRQALDRLAYSAIVASSVRWRLSTHLFRQWELYKQSRRKTDGAPSVKNAAAFYAEHLVMGSMGRMGPFGLRGAENGIVVQDAWYLFNKYFPPDAAVTASFADFVARAHRYNPNRRITQFRKMLFTGLEQAAALPVGRLSEFFDRLAAPEEAARLEEYQRTRQETDLGIFAKAVSDTVFELNAGLPQGQRIVGVVLMGSFANGAAGPESDLDAQAIAENGSSVHVKAFSKRLQQRWEDAGMSRHELGLFQYALPLSKGLVSRLHREAYLVFSPYPEVRELMQRSEAEDAAQAPSRARGFSGRAVNFLYVWLVSAILAVYEFSRWSKRALSD